MRIIALADTHKAYKLFNLPKADVLIHAGDLDVYDYRNELIDFVKWLQKQPIKYKIVIAGNHDKFIFTNNYTSKEILKDYCIYLENSGIEIEGIKFWGSPITPIFLDWFFMAERGEQINKYWKEIPSDTHILITHGPSYGILDQTLAANGEQADNVGCLDLYKRVEELRQNKLKYHIFGHIHEAYGTVTKNNTTFINCSVMNEEYELVNRPVIIDI